VLASAFLSFFSPHCFMGPVSPSAFFFLLERNSGLPLFVRGRLLSMPVGVLLSIWHLVFSFAVNRGGGVPSSRPLGVHQSSSFLPACGFTPPFVYAFSHWRRFSDPVPFTSLMQTPSTSVNVLLSLAAHPLWCVPFPFLAISSLAVRLFFSSPVMLLCRRFLSPSS
jgi:hypothetical protein